MGYVLGPQLPPEQEQAETKAFGRQLLWGFAVAQAAFLLLVVPFGVVLVLAGTETGVSNGWFGLQAIGTLFVGAIAVPLAMPGLALIAHEGYPRWLGAASVAAVVLMQFWLLWMLWNLDGPAGGLPAVFAGGFLCAYLALACITLFGRRRSDGPAVRTANAIVLGCIAAAAIFTETVLGLAILSPEDGAAAALDPLTVEEAESDDDGVPGLVLSAVFTIAVCGSSIVPIMRLGERTARNGRAQREPPPPPPPPPPPAAC